MPNTEQYDFTIKNCNNIKSGNISIIKQKLNIRYAPNGTGKTTISEAIKLKSEGTPLSVLTPFKLKESNPDSLEPSLECSEEINNVLKFDETYIENILFKEDELLKGSFDILFRTTDYKKLEGEVKELIKEVRETFQNNEELNKLLEDLKELNKTFKTKADGTLAKNAPFYKALEGGNLLDNIPEDLASFTPFLHSEQPSKWIGWHSQGAAYCADKTSCPYCTTDTISISEKIKKVDELYDKKVIEHLSNIVKVIEQLGDYFSEETKTKLLSITSLSGSFDETHHGYIAKVKIDLESFIATLDRIKDLSGSSFSDGAEVQNELTKSKIHFSLIGHLDSAKTQEAIKPINDAIDNLIAKSSELMGKIKHQQATIRRMIVTHQDGINDFLELAGYKYKVELIGENEDIQLKLRHIDHTSHISGKENLSYGEKNAFAIVLFMYHCLKDEPDLIILDDPISSFDTHKKYAILDRLFRHDSKDCLKSKTVLLLTHDIEPLIDTLKSKRKEFAGQVSAAFLKLQDGVIEELEIKSNDLKTFPQICSTAVDSSSKHQVIKLIYMRRLAEITDSGTNKYQVLSNLFHKRNKDSATDNRLDGDGLLESEKFDSGCEVIKNSLPDFDYEAVLQILLDAEELEKVYGECSNNYEKLQVFRLFFSGDTVEDKDRKKTLHSVLLKFVTGTFHIENEFICQLDPADFPTIPGYIIASCDMYVEHDFLDHEIITSV